MPIEKGDLLSLNSTSCEGKLRNKGCVCKKLPIFMVREMLFSGKGLHTYKVPNQSG
jgi:hypothetical protein